MIATLYDVHGNLRALDAVLAGVPDEAMIVVGGDTCWGGEEPGETLERVRGTADREPVAELTEEPALLQWPAPAVRSGDVLHVHASLRNDEDMQFEREIAGKRVVNSGSVGTPYERQPGASWTLDLVHRRTPYDGAVLLGTRDEAPATFTERGL